MRIRSLLTILAATGALAGGGAAIASAASTTSTPTKAPATTTAPGKAAPMPSRHAKGAAGSGSKSCPNM